MNVVHAISLPLPHGSFDGTLLALHRWIHLAFQILDGPSRIHAVWSVDIYFGSLLASSLLNVTRKVNWVTKQFYTSVMSAPFSAARSLPAPR